MWWILAATCWPLEEIGRCGMKCAMALHDPCDSGEVQLHVLHVPGDVVGVPLCWRHVRSWDGGSHGVFRNFTEDEREKWARLAAERAKRQEALTR
jgi:hypothetical protein